MKQDTEWQKSFFEYVEQIIRHDLPNVPAPIDPDFEPRTQGSPDPSAPNFDALFLLEIKKCAEALQRHSTL
jgi:hypothetical protein